jgi:hypothetical protein
MSNEDFLSSPLSKNPLTVITQKTLADLLESNGGLKSFQGKHNCKLSKVLDQVVAADDNKAVIFGRPGEQPIRRKLQLKVLRWQEKLKKGLYHSEVLDVLGIPSFEIRKEQHLHTQTRCTPTARRAPIPAPSFSSSSSNSGSSSSSSEDSNQRVQNNSSPLPQFLFRPKKVQEISTPTTRDKTISIKEVTAEFQPMSMLSMYFSSRTIF